MSETTTNGKRRHVFISHHSKDDAEVSKLTDLLSRKGYDIRNSSVRAKPANQKRLEQGLVKDETIRRLLRMKISWAGATVTSARSTGRRSIGRSRNRTGKERESSASGLRKVRTRLFPTTSTSIGMQLSVGKGTALSTPSTENSTTATVRTARSFPAPNNYSHPLSVINKANS